MRITISQERFKEEKKMKTMKRNVLLVVALATFALSSSALVINAIPNASAEETAATTTNTVGAINDTLTDADYYFKGYSLEWDNGTKYGDANSGLTAIRFKMYVTEAMYNYVAENAKTVTTGTLIYPAKYVGGQVANLTVNSTYGSGEDLAKPIDLDTTAAWGALEEKETIGGVAYAYESVTFLNQIPQEYYTAPIAVRGYVKVGETYYYTDATNETARSLTEIAKIEYDALESKLADYEEAYKDALMKFKFQLDENEVEYVYYGDTLENMPEEKVGSVELYTNAKGTAIWKETNVFKGNTKLVTESVDAKQYYAKPAAGEEDVATFNVEGATDGETTATVNGQTLSAVVADGKVTVNGLGALELTAGKAYLMQVGGAKLGFTPVTAINDYVPYAKDDTLWFPQLGENTVSAITTLTGENKNVDGAIDGVTENKLANTTTDVSIAVAQEGDSLLVTASDNSVYKISTKIYARVLYNDTDAADFFFGSTGLAHKGCLNAVALATNVNAGDGVAYTAGQFTGLFDGCGYSVSWNANMTTNKSGLFGYMVRGIVKNVALFPTFGEVSGSNVSYPIICHYGVATTTVQNVFIKASMASPNNMYTLTSVYFQTTQINTEDVVCVYNGETGLQRAYLNGPFVECRTGDTSMLTNTDGVFTVNTAYATTVTKVEGQDSQFVYDNKTTKNVHVITPAKTTPKLGRVEDETNTIFMIGENQAYTTTELVKQVGVNCYAYGDATIATQVGSWKINLGSEITDITATFVR